MTEDVATAVDWAVPAGSVRYDGRREETTPTVDIAIPVYNEERGLEASTVRLHRYLSEQFPLPWRITIVDNASTDRTWAIACGLAARLDRVSAVHLDAKGRGRALRKVWSSSDAPVVAYMDVDLSTDLDALLPLVAPLVSGHSDVAVGTRLAASSRVSRGSRREAISRIYNLILRATLQVGYSDAQCGFKAIRKEVAQQLLPLVENQEWFFDTELLTLAEHNGYRIHEVPVDWVDDDDSRVHVVSTATEDLRGVWRMTRTFAAGGGVVPGVDARDLPAPGRPDGQIARFASIGLVSTVLFGALFLLLFNPLGPFLADIVAVAVCTVANTSANRRYTFSLRGRRRRVRHQLAALVVALLPLALNLLTLALMVGAGVTSAVAMVVALTLVNAVASLARFALLARWVFRPEPASKA